jgi:hypothetical protein
MLQSAITSPKTTAIGFAIGILNLLGSGAHVDWRSVAISAGIAALGMLAKDGDKSHAPAPLAVPEKVN